MGNVATFLNSMIEMDFETDALSLLVVFSVTRLFLVIDFAAVWHLIGHLAR